MSLLDRIRAKFGRRRPATTTPVEKGQPPGPEKLIRGRKPGDKIVTLRRRKALRSRKRRKR